MIEKNIVQVTLIMFYFFVPEILSIIIFEKRDKRIKFRFGGDGLNPYISTMKAALVMAPIILFSPILVGCFLDEIIKNWLLGVGSKLLFIDSAVLVFTILYVRHQLLGKQLDKTTAKMCGIIILLISIFILIWYLGG